MINQICTAATARRLKEQGFPQPVPAPGQVWYMANKTPFICTCDCGSHFAIAWIDRAGLGEMRKGVISSCAYAPTAADILQELGANHALTNSIDGSTWLCEFMESTALTTPFHKITLLAFHDNPAEACAMAWEAKQKRG